ncbi:CobF: precorrin-6A synthase (deacetylating) [Tepidimonas thermarum]|uniref:CobF: precorrin-6A synthase (Deacetylating) n=1 Tax=Tepidimonas thermarum TaxID=335431 RepID=A0A554WXS5_9BURK|nr:precorrin-6A synthase (deacetylating) [Tepidimonas thermarum]TSE28383.1 CobF: precorrin-6A synthase (deacetylating) [Tepidimonas thermarum]
MKIHLSLIGMGAGHPDHITRQGMAALQRAQLVLVPHKGAEKADLAELRLELCRQLLPPGNAVVAPFDMPVREGADIDYLGAVDRWHDAIAQIWLDTIARHLPGGGAVALLVWGDPSLYDSSLRIAQRLAQRVQLTTTVVPGITALQALTAAHAIPLNDLNAPVLITTGRQLRERGWPAGADTVAVLLDGQCSFQTLAPEGLHIWWGAFLGMPHQLCISGPLAAVSETILRERAQARARHGWIMDTYLLKRVTDDET